MSRYLRPKQPGATVFFTVTLAERGSDLLVRHIEVLRDAARRTRADKPFGIDAWVVLPDHMHCVWTLPEGDADYSVRMASIKARFTMELGKLESGSGCRSGCRSGFSPTPAQNPYGAIGGRRRVGLKPDLPGDEPRGNEQPIWQKRFWEHHIRDEADYAAHVQYCWINPVKHGLVAEPKEWPYSSFHRDNP